MKVIKEKGQKGFLLWVKENQPKLYAEFLKRQNKTLSGFGAIGDPLLTSTESAASPAWVTNLTGALQGAAQIYLTKTQLDSQRKILDMQLSRAQQGLAPLPLDPMQYGLSPTVGVGIAPQTQTLLMWGAGLLAAVYLLPKLLSGKR